MSAYRQAHQTCAHHAGVLSARTCRKCDEPLCEPCCAFVVNDDDVWCSRCGGALEGDGRFEHLILRLAPVIGVGLVALLGALARHAWGNHGLTVISTAMLVAYAALVRFLQLQRTRSGPQISHSPRITRRQPGDALPKPRVWLSKRPVEPREGENWEAEEAE